MIVRNFHATQLSAIVPSVRPIRPFLGILTLTAAAPLCVARTLQPPNAAATSILPMPREYSSRGTISLLHGVSVSAGSNAEDRFAAADLEAWLRQLDITAKKGHSALPIELLRGDSRTAKRLMVKAEVSIDPQMHEDGYARWLKSYLDADKETWVVQREMIAAYQLIDQAKIRVSTDVLFRADPWSKDGQAMVAELRPLLSPLRLHDERAITLAAQARAAGPLRETDALDALELGARRLDFIRQNFETSDLIAHTYQQAYAVQGDPALSKRISGMLGLISGANGLCQNMRNGYSKARLGYSQRWLTENRPYWLQNVLVRYDLTTQLRVVRADQFQSAHRSWSTSPTLPVAADLGIPQEQGN